MNESVFELLKMLQTTLAQASVITDRLYDALDTPDEPELWVLPVGTEDFPPERWYVAQRHTQSHTGLDINLDEPPWGDVERGFPIFSIASGMVLEVGQSDGWLSVVVIRHQHEGDPIYVRYAHLESISLFEGQGVEANNVVGYLGNWKGGDGGDHLHFDMALDHFHWAAWRTPGVTWVDPVPVLKAHINPDLVDAMMRRGD
jgi:murein DD-endopeptidase MepM/ murein hydrolase activator NlpD